MDTSSREDIQKMALKFDEIYKETPEDYYFLKGYICCLLQKLCKMPPDSRLQKQSHDGVTKSTQSKQK